MDAAKVMWLMYEVRCRHVPVHCVLWVWCRAGLKELRSGMTDLQKLSLVCLAFLLM